MDSSLHASSITLSDFKSHLDSYPDYVPSKIQGLEELRLHEIPETLGKRRKDGDAFIEKTEAMSLLKWKLKHGKYRPSLMSILNMNTADKIRATTHGAFTAYESDKDDYAAPITQISTLKGVGPATASLFLSCYDPANFSFFSDDLYRYLHWEDVKFRGWDRRIYYTMKEYKELHERCQSMRQLLEEESGEPVSVIDIKKMAYALAKHAHQTTRRWKRKQDGYVEPKKRKREATSWPG